MNRATLRLVMLVSCAHALVHVYELALPSVEQLIGTEFGVGKTVTGPLGSCWRLPFGLGAFFAGWLCDRFGSKPMLVIYLTGCAASCAFVWTAPTLAMLFLTMFVMGSFASIYHPAGLALISHETSAANRPMALGYHGIFGSAGIAAAPFLAGLVLGATDDWRQYYLFLVAPGALLALLIHFRLVEHHRQAAATASPSDVTSDEDRDAHWGRFFVLTVIGAMAGFIYAALINFLPRYLGQSHLSYGGIPPESLRNYLTGGVLMVGIVGQFTAGRVARPGRLEPFMVLILLGNAPPLLWMAFAQGTARVWAAGLFALVHFMHQPVYNSLVAGYVPRRRRSFGFGISNTMTFGVGSFGAAFAGFARSDLANYGTLAALAATSAALALGLWAWTRAERAG